MGVCRVILTLALIAALAVSVTKASPSSLSDIESEIALLETNASEVPSAESVLSAAQAYAASKIAKATTASREVLAEAVVEGRKKAEIQGPAAPTARPSRAVLDRVKVEADAKANAEAMKVLAAATAKKEADKQAEVAKKEAAIALARRLSLSPPGQVLTADSKGVFGAVNFGLPKVEAVPSPAPLKKKFDRRSALNKFKDHGAKDLYGKAKSCLKDIAAHFDEKDIYESKKISLLQRMQQTNDGQLSLKLRKRLGNLEHWHQMMQKKFIMSANEMKEFEKKQDRLFDAHLPQALKDQLKANKVAKRAGQKIPFPGAKKTALKTLRNLRHTIAKDERMSVLGHKKMLRPEIDNKGFPSMDPISSALREKLWRNVNTENEWSTDGGDIEQASNIVNAAHKAHGDFQEGPIAEPLLRGKLYKPDTEPLGVPNFLTNFPWPKEPETEVTMNDKMKVEQTYHQTW